VYVVTNERLGLIGAAAAAQAVSDSGCTKTDQA